MIPFVVSREIHVLKERKWKVKIRYKMSLFPIPSQTKKNQKKGPLRARSKLRCDIYKIKIYSKSVFASFWDDDIHTYTHIYTNRLTCIGRFYLQKSQNWIFTIPVVQTPFYTGLNVVKKVIFDFSYFSERTFFYIYFT